MPRSLNLSATFALALIVCLPGHAQDSPSLGDLARQAQKDKSSAPSKKVFTNDDLPSGPTFGAQGSSGLAAGVGHLGQAQPSDAQSAPATPSAELDRLESLLDQVASLDRATLVKTALRGADSDFPGRGAWEEKLVAARDAYVSQGRVLIQKAKQIESSAENLKGNQNPNDPRVKDLTKRIQQLAQDGVRIGAAFQAVMMEGRDLAGLPQAQ